MRPHRLRFAGIGPYPEPVEIDFDELGTLGLYLIVGPTGAGKTTIFDALTFALYGEVAGSRQQAIKGFVSDHEFAGEPFVELEFSHRDRRFRARRRPPSDDRNSRPNDHRLVEIDEHGGEGEAVTGTRDVTARVHELLGLEVEQFKRVVLIPQNEFQDFLIAKDPQKEEILRALFDTALYRRVAERMQDVARELRVAAEALERELEVTAGVAREAVTKLVEDGFLAPRDEDEPFSVEAALEDVAPLVEHAGKRREEADARHTDAAKRQAEAVEAERRFAAAAELDELRAIAEREAAADAAAAEALRLHERAVQVAGPAGRAQVAASESMRLEGLAAQAAERLAGIVAERARALACLAPLAGLAPDAAPGQLRAAIQQLAEGLGTAARLYAEAEADRAAITEAEHVATAADEAVRAADETITKLDTEIGAHQAETAQLIALANGLLEAQRAVMELDAALAAASVDPARDAHAEAQRLLRAAEARLATAEAQLAAARAALDAEHAGRLAAGLADGAPCPVCGATDHPHPAPQSPAAAATDAAEAERGEATDAVAAARQSEAAAAERLATALAAQAGLPAPAEQDALRAALASASTAQAALEGRAAGLTTLSTRRDAATRARAEAATALATARSTIETVEPARRRRLEQAAQIAAHAEVADALEVLGEAGDAIDALASAGQNLAEARAVSDEAAAGLVAALAASGFATTEAARVAQLAPETLAANTVRIEASTARTRKIDQLAGAAGDPATLPAERPDVAVLAAAAAAAKQEQGAAVRRSESLGLAWRTLEETRARLADRLPVAAEARTRAKQANELAMVFKNGDATRLSLEKWVLRAFFEEVCSVATHRLEQLSRGRYRLSLDERAAGRKGLAIVVFDAHTGKARPVELLSGGEKFLASLALALGLADVVQSQSGGIDLSTMFIDEGFGSLDQETLDIAVDVLRDLLDSGRTVGVITHVEAMKQELPVGLEVVRGTRGSSVRTGSALA